MASDDDLVGAIALLGAIVARSSAEQVLFTLLMLDADTEEWRRVQRQAARDYIELRKFHPR